MGKLGYKNILVLKNLITLNLNTFKKLVLLCVVIVFLKN